MGVTSKGKSVTSSTQAATLEGRVAVITGAGSGIGQALAQRLAGLGCDLALGDIDEQRLAETATLLPGSCRISRHRLDVSDREGFQTFAREVLSHHSQLDIVINNAGILRLHSIEQGRYEDYDATLDVNVRGVLHGCKEFLPHLRKRPEAWLVNISSAAGLGAFES